MPTVLIMPSPTKRVLPGVEIRDHLRPDQAVQRHEPLKGIQILAQGNMRSKYL